MTDANAAGARGPASTHLDVAAQNADLGLPVARDTRFRFPKRVLGRIMWVFGRHQASYNHAIVEAVAELANSVEAMRTALPEQVGNDIGSMRSEVGALEARLHELEARVRDLAARLDAKNT